MTEIRGEELILAKGREIGGFGVKKQIFQK